MLSKFACCCGEGTLLFCVVMASCVSGTLVYLLLRSRMSLQSLEGFVLYEMFASVVFQMVSCCFRMSSDISLLRLCNLLMTSGTCRCELSKVVACVKFKSNFSIETGAVVFNSPGWDELFTVVYDRGCEVFGGCVDAGEVVNVKVCKYCHIT